MFVYYLTSELLIVDPKMGSRLSIGPKEGCLLRSIKPSPDSSSVLCNVLAKGEFSFLVPYDSTFAVRILRSLFSFNAPLGVTLHTDCTLTVH